MTTTKLIPQGARLLVKSVYQTMTEGGIAIPERAQDKRTVARAEVLAVGAGVPASGPGAVLDEDGEPVAVGGHVFFMAGSGVAVEHAGRLYLIVKADEVLAVESAPTPDPLAAVTLGDGPFHFLDLGGESGPEGAS